jgi:hypothetical protein
MISGVTSDYNIGLFALLGLAWGSIALVGWCDVALVVCAIRPRQDSASAQASFPRTGDWIVWVVATCMSLYTFWPLYRRVGGSSDLVIPLLLGPAIILFDVALALDAFKSSRGRRTASC